MTDIRLRCRTCGVMVRFPEPEDMPEEWCGTSEFGVHKGDGVVEHPAFCSEECKEAY